MRTAAIAALVALVAFATPTPAAADVTNDCITANEHTIQLRKEGKLLDARTQLPACAATACPAEIQRVCRQRADDVNSAIPTIVFEVTDSKGRDVVGARVVIDGVAAETDATVTAISLDPGEHRFRFEIPNEQPVERVFVLHEGEKQRRERISRAPVALAPTPTLSPPSSALRNVGIASGVAGLVLVGVGATFGGLASLAWSNAKTACTTANCPSATRPQAVTDHDNASTYAAVSTVGIIGGGALLAFGIVMFALAPRQATKQTALHYSVDGVWGEF